MTIPAELAFQPEEYQQRIHRVRSSWDEAGVDGVVLFTPANVYYLSGMDNESLTDLQCLVMSRSEPPTLVISGFEAGRAVNSCWLEDVVSYWPGEDPLAALIGVLKRHGLESARIAIDEGPIGLPPSTYGRLLTLLPGATIQGSSGIVEACRLRKSPAELAYVRQAADWTDRAAEAAIGAIRVGGRDCEVAATLVEALYGLGSDIQCWGPIVASGYRAGAPHSTFNGRRMVEGETVFLEFTASARRYTAPVMRTVTLGPPTPQIRSIAEAEIRTLDAIVRTAKPGVPANVVAEAALSELNPVLKGLVFHHTFGYPVGIGFPPTWIENSPFRIRTDNPQRLEEGMLFHLPISLRSFGEFGVCQSHTIAITEAGAQRLTGKSPGLVVV
jgi:Xaa-Pro dipeptidase